jgi:hypothetical protein
LLDELEDCDLGAAGGDGAAAGGARVTGALRRVVDPCEVIVERDLTGGADCGATTCGRRVDGVMPG